MLHNVCTKPNFVCLVATPYENQIRLIFTRLKELVDCSPKIKASVIKCTQSPYNMTLNNNSRILGFTTGAASNSGAASLRGQKCDALYLDEMDYMGDSDFDTIATIAAERPDITMFISSTPTGARKKFYECCTNKDLGYKEFHFPSSCNPNWGPEMEAEFRSQLSDQGYIHEIEAEFGTEEAGVFNKDNIDLARQMDYYAYNKLDMLQETQCQKDNCYPTMLLYDEEHPAPFNLYRTVGIDLDKYQASSSIVVTEYVPELQLFRVLKRVELPKAEYSYDTAFNAVLSINKIYNPAWIYCDRGSEEYFIEKLHIYGKEHPETGLHNKVKGWQFANVIEIEDPVTHEMQKKPMKSFMVNQLTIAFDRHRLMLSPFDDLIYNQLIAYTVERIGKNGQPVFTSTNEHFVDALGLSYLAFVLEFGALVNTIKEVERSHKVNILSKTQGGQARQINRMFESVKSPFASGATINRTDDDDLPGDKPPNYQVYKGFGTKVNKNSYGSWGSRNVYRSRNTGRTMW